MNIEEFREYCLSFKGVHEKMPFPNVPDKYSRDVLCFYVADKWFCFVNIEIFDFCCIKCNPDESGELQTEYTGIRPGWHMNKKYWISVYFNQDVPDEKIKDTGLTMQRLLDTLGTRGPREIHIASLLVKPDKLKVDLNIEYVAMNIPNDFIVGYGLDYDGFGRNYPDIYTVVD